jgi:hypothetical protein
MRFRATVVLAWEVDDTLIEGSSKTYLDTHIHGVQDMLVVGKVVNMTIDTETNATGGDDTSKEASTDAWLASKGYIEIYKGCHTKDGWPTVEEREDAKLRWLANSQVSCDEWDHAQADNAKEAVVRVLRSLWNSADVALKEKKRLCEEAWERLREADGFEA